MHLTSSMSPESRAGAFVGKIGSVLSRVQVRGKHRLVSALGRSFSSVCPEVHCFRFKDDGMTIRLTDRIERFMWAGCYESQLVALLNWALRPGMVFVDAGAHIGYFATLAAWLVGEQGEVLCFEPDPDCASRLATNTRNYSWVHLHHAAVRDEVGEVTFFRSPRADESGWGTIFSATGPRPQIRVRMTTLDETFTRHSLKRLDFIKLDIEGAEHRALEGGDRTIARYRPSVFLEVNEVCRGWDNKSPRDIISFFTDRAYAVRYVPGRKGRIESMFATPKERHTPPEVTAALNPILRQSIRWT